MLVQWVPKSAVESAYREASPFLEGPLLLKVPLQNWPQSKVVRPHYINHAAGVSEVHLLESIWPLATPWEPNCLVLS